VQQAGAGAGRRRQPDGPRGVADGRRCRVHRRNHRRERCIYVSRRHDGGPRIRNRDGVHGGEGQPRAVALALQQHARRARRARRSRLLGRLSHRQVVLRACARQASRPGMQLQRERAGAHPGGRMGAKRGGST
jgi:hypothetical protein